MDYKSVQFRKLVESFGGLIEPLPDKAFKGSGTMVNTCKVVIQKGR